MKLSALTLLLLHGSFNIPAGNAVETISELLEQSGIPTYGYVGNFESWPDTHAFRCQGCTVLEASCAMLKDTGFELVEVTSFGAPAESPRVHEPVADNRCNEPQSGYRLFDIPALTMTNEPQVVWVVLQIDPQMLPLRRRIRGVKLNGIDITKFPMTLWDAHLAKPNHDVDLMVPPIRPLDPSPRPAPSPIVRKPPNRPANTCRCDVIHDPIGPFDEPTGVCIEKDGSQRWMPDACRAP